MINDFAVYKIIIFTICLILILRTVFLFIRKKKTFRELLVAIIIWGFFGLIGLYPNLTDYIAKLTGFQLGLNALVVASLIFLFYNVMTQSLKNDNLENLITKIVRNQALNGLAKKRKL